MNRGLPAAFAGALLLASMSASAGIGSEPSTPHFVSLRTVGANGRHGPGLEHRVDWIYQRAGLPLQVIDETGPWRRVTDPGGDQVWMHIDNLDNRRTAYLVRPSLLRRAARDNAQALAQLSAGVIGALTGCDGKWRRIAIGGRVGWVDEQALWGAEDCAGL